MSEIYESKGSKIVKHSVNLTTTSSERQAVIIYIPYFVFLMSFCLNRRRWRTITHKENRKHKPKIPSRIKRTI